MTCAVCGKPCRVVRHEFVTGNLPGTPSWTIHAPTYFRASSDGRSAVAVFCGSACSTHGTHRMTRTLSDAAPGTAALADVNHEGQSQ